MTIVFLDIEFTSLTRKPSLLSLALVSLGGEEHYVELDLSTPAGVDRLKAASNFARREVLVHWNLMPGAADSIDGMARRTAAWLQAQTVAAGGAVEVGYDYHADYDLLEDLLLRHKPYADLVSKLMPTHLGYLLDEDGKQAIDASIAGEPVLRRHHALADARALRAAYSAAHLTRHS